MESMTTYKDLLELDNIAGLIDIICDKDLIPTNDNSDSGQLDRHHDISDSDFNIRSKSTGHIFVVSKHVELIHNLVSRLRQGGVDGIIIAFLYCPLLADANVLDFNKIICNGADDAFKVDANHTVTKLDIEIMIAKADGKRQITDFGIANARDDLKWSLIGDLFRYIPSLNETLQEGQGMIGAGKICKKIGSGATALVYLVKEGNRTYAIKSILRSTLNHVSDLASIDREIMVMLMINSHKNIVNIIDVLHGPLALHIRMKLVGQSNLGIYLKGKYPLSLHVVLRLSQHICCGMAHLHSLGISHRDIKPENMMMNDTNDDKSLQLVIIDFGLAILTNEQHILYDKCGTVPFVAPEIVIGRGYGGFQSDCWSIGAVFLELNYGPYTVEAITGLTSKQKDTINPSLLSNLSIHRCQGNPINALVEHITSRFLCLDITMRWTAQQGSLCLDGDARGCLQASSRDSNHAFVNNICSRSGIYSFRQEPPPVKMMKMLKTKDSSFNSFASNIKHIPHFQNKAMQMDKCLFWAYQFAQSERNASPRDMEHLRRCHFLQLITESEFSMLRDCLLEHVNIEDLSQSRGYLNDLRKSVLNGTRSRHHSQKQLCPLTWTDEMEGVSRLVLDAHKQDGFCFIERFQVPTLETLRTHQPSFTFSNPKMAARDLVSARDLSLRTLSSTSASSDAVSFWQLQIAHEIEDMISDPNVRLSPGTFTTKMSRTNFVAQTLESVLREPNLCFHANKGMDKCLETIHSIITGDEMDHLSCIHQYRDAHQGQIITDDDFDTLINVLHTKGWKYSELTKLESKRRHVTASAIYCEAFITLPLTMKMKLDLSTIEEDDINECAINIIASIDKNYLKTIIPQIRSEMGHIKDMSVDDLLQKWVIRHIQDILQCIASESEFTGMAPATLLEWITQNSDPHTFSCIQIFQNAISQLCGKLREDQIPVARGRLVRLSDSRQKTKREIQVPVLPSVCDDLTLQQIQHIVSRTCRAAATGTSASLRMIMNGPNGLIPCANFSMSRGLYNAMQNALEQDDIDNIRKIHKDLGINAHHILSLQRLLMKTTTDEAPGSAKKVSDAFNSFAPALSEDEFIQDARKECMNTLHLPSLYDSLKIELFKAFTRFPETALSKMAECITKFVGSVSTGGCPKETSKLMIPENVQRTHQCLDISSDEFTKYMECCSRAIGSQYFGHDELTNELFVNFKDSVVTKSDDESGKKSYDVDIKIYGHVYCEEVPSLKITEICPKLRMELGYSMEDDMDLHMLMKNWNNTKFLNDMITMRMSSFSAPSLNKNDAPIKIAMKNIPMTSASRGHFLLIQVSHVLPPKEEPNGMPRCPITNRVGVNCPMRK